MSTRQGASVPTRQEIARTACYEVGQLAKMLREYIEATDPSGEVAPRLRGGLLRLDELSEIIYDAIITDEPDNSDDDLTAKIGGRQALGRIEEAGDRSEGQAIERGEAITPDTCMDTLDLEDMRELIREASGVVERFARLAVVTANDDGFDDLLPQFMDRVLACNSVILSASGGDNVTVGEAFEAVFGRFGPRFEDFFATTGGAA